MPLDSKEKLSYTESGTQSTQLPKGSSATENEGDPMIVFLSFPRREEKYEKVVSILRKRGLTIFTNFDRVGLEGAERKTDLRLERIRNSDVFVFFAAPATARDWSPMRQIEFGYALGHEVPVVFVGQSLNSLHRFHDVFSDVDSFLDGFYSAAYNELIQNCLPYLEKTQVA